MNVTPSAVQSVGFTREVWQRPEGDVSYLERTGSDGLVVFSHANGFNAETYREILAAIDPNAHVVALDARGHGFTSLPAEPSSHSNWDIYREDLIAFVEHVRPCAETPVILAGHSMGATTSLLVAKARPDLVNRVLLFEPVVIPPFARYMMPIMRALGIWKRPSLADGARKRRAVWPNREALIERYTGRGAFKTWKDGFLRAYIDGGTVDRDDGQIELACAPEWEAANFESHADGLWRGLDSITCPVVLIHGTEQSTCPDPMAKRLMRRIRNMRRRIVKGAGHFLPMEFPGIVIEEINNAVNLHREVGDKSVGERAAQIVRDGDRPAGV